MAVSISAVSHGESGTQRLQHMTKKYAHAAYLSRVTV